jgi:hypothetical protein
MWSGSPSTVPLWGWCPNLPFFTTESQSHGENPWTCKNQKGKVLPSSVGFSVPLCLCGEKRMGASLMWKRWSATQSTFGRMFSCNPLKSKR